jgi:hypothetical protein
VGRARSSAAARTMRFIDIRRIRLSFVFYLTGVSDCRRRGTGRANSQASVDIRLVTRDIRAGWA